VKNHAAIEFEMAENGLPMLERTGVPLKKIPNGA
jgi:hypothetical protein